MDFKYLFTSLSGRINRAPYWQGVLLLVVISIFVTIGIVMAIVSPEGSVSVLLVLIAIGLLLYAASVPLTVKRLHDRGKSGHYAWLLYGSAIVGSAVDPKPANLPSLIVALVTIAIGLWFFVELGFFRGMAGPNAYGPDPLESK